MTGTELEPYGAVGSALAVSDGAITGLALPDDTPIETLQTILGGMNRLQSSSMWVVGDAALFLKAHFPQQYQEALSSLSEYDPKTVGVAAAVCKVFPDHAFRARFLVAYPGRRALTFAHFSRVRRYGSDIAEYWLERSATEDLSTTQLNDLLEEGAPGADVPPPLPQERNLEDGVLYAIGPHRLVIGKAEDPAVLQTLFTEGERASMIWTDPPYGVDYVGKTEDALTIQHDTSTGLEDMLVGAWKNAIPYCEESTAAYVTAPSGDRGEVFLRAFRLAGWIFKQTLIWRKNTIVLGRSDYQYQHEPILYCQLPGQKMGRMVSADPDSGEKRGHRWYGGDNKPSIFDVPKPPASREHPTMKPVKLIQQHIENSSQAGNIILDLFAGSGSTMIAAELTGRRAFMVEYDWRYAQSIVDRYLRFLEEQARTPTQDPAPEHADVTSAAYSVLSED
jgi:DNA modification methylase